MRGWTILSSVISLTSAVAANFGPVAPSRAVQSVSVVFGLVLLLCSLCLAGGSAVRDKLK